MPIATKEFFLERAKELKKEYHCLEGTIQAHNAQLVGRKLLFLQSTIEVNYLMARIYS